MYTYKLKSLGLIYIIIILIAFGGIAYAGIGAHPTVTEVIVPPDKITKGTIKIANGGTEAVQVIVQPEDWLKRRTGESTFPVEEWLTVTPAEFTVEPVSIKEVEYTIKPPRGAKGELNAMVFFATAAETQTGLDVTSRFGVSIYAAIEGTIDLECDINSVKVRRNIIEKEDGGTIDRGMVFTINVENKGNVHIRPAGMITVNDQYGNNFDIEIEKGFPVYPGSSLNYAIIWDETDLLAGYYEATITLDYGNIYNIDEVFEKTIDFSIDVEGNVSY